MADTNDSINSANSEAVKHDIAHEHSLFRQIFAGGGGASERVRFWDRERKQVGGGRP